MFNILSPKTETCVSNFLQIFIFQVNLCISYRLLAPAHFYKCLTSERRYTWRTVFSPFFSHQKHLVITAYVREKQSYLCTSVVIWVQHYHWLLWWAYKEERILFLMKLVENKRERKYYEDHWNIVDSKTISF